ncbi:MAG: methionyl-tRNA formyltransferase [Pirellulaceae bacterium]
MKIVCLGTGPFAVPTLERLCQGPHEVAAVVTRPERSASSRRKVPPAPMRLAAEAHGITVQAPASVNVDEGLEFLQSRQADLLFVCDYGEILKPAALAAARLGGINLHGSLLPRHRGAAPVHAAILAGDATTGVSVIHMTPGLDAGPVLAVRSTEIGEHENQVELEDRLSRLGVDAVLEAIDLLSVWDGVSPIGQPQDPALVTRAPRLRKEQGRIDWRQSAIVIDRQIRGLQPWPGCDSLLMRPCDEQPLRVLMERAEVADDHPQSSTPGAIVEASKSGLWIATGDGVLRVLKVKPEGKRAMEVADFINGTPLPDGSRFVSAVD